MEFTVSFCVQKCYVAQLMAVFIFKAINLNTNGKNKISKHVNLNRNYTHGFHSNRSTI